MHILTSIIVVSVIVCAYHHSAKACEEGWFGPECQYKCRCQQACSPEGECPAKCQDGWFGIKCQYRLLQYKAKTVYSQVDITTLLSDNNETTCIQIDSEQIFINLTRIYLNPWIRFFTQQPDLLYTLEISFMDFNSQYVNASSKERLFVQDNTVDIHISVNEYFIKYIILQGEAIQRLCSLWIISGQNVATKQNVYHSNSSINQIDTNLPQYPQASDGLYTCNTNDSGNAAVYWEIIMNPTLVINEYRFYFNDVLGVSRYMTFQAFDNDGEIFNTFISSQMSSAKSYGVITMFNTFTKAFTIVLSSSSTNKNLTLLLCEVEAFTECSEGTWGVQCTNTCNEKCPDLCRFDDGLCNNGCFGYSDPPMCSKACEAGTWGLNCTKTCSNHCLNSSCDRVTGLCNKGCIGYRDPPQCTTECGIGFWGINCTKMCNGCVDSSCDSKTGWCDLGCVGFSNAPYCTIACEAQTWGINCSNSCSNHCLNSSCDRVTGLCDKGCIEYKDPPHCTTECDTGFWGLNCTNKCSSCVNSSCNSKTGWCDRGCIGFNDAPYCTTACAAGTWGLNCTKTCSNQCFKSSCDRVTGLCDRGCTEYSDPPYCTKACETGTWGLNCTKTCSNHCLISSCDRVTGLCDRGCIGYRNPPHCTTDCETGFWGINCINKCNRCVDLSCNSKTGWCDRGCVGFSDAPYCTTVCASGFWGVNCTNKCSNSCVELSCDGITGYCDLGCIPSANCTLLLKASESFSQQTVIAIAVSIATAAILAIVISIIVLKVKADNERNAHREKNTYIDVFQPMESRASHQPVSKADDISEYVQSDESTSTYLNPVKIRKNQQIDKLDGHCEMNAPRERNSYIDAYDPDYVVASCQPVSESDEIALDLQSNGSTHLNPVDVNENQQIDYLDGNPYEKPIISI